MPPSPALPPSPLAVLRERDFALYWCGQLVSLTGGWMQQLALSWVVLGLAKSAFVLGVVNFVAAVPPAALMLHGGVAADRFDKRRILIATQLLFLLGALALAALIDQDLLRLPHVFAFTIVIGVVLAFDLPASQALVPDLVRTEQIPAAVQLNQAIFHGSRLIGPALGGWLIARYGTSIAFLANAVSFIPVIATLLIVRTHPSHAARPRPTGSAMREGLAYVRREPRLRALLGLTAMVTVLVFPNMVVLMPYYVKSVLHLDAHAMGLLMSVGEAGALVGSLSLLVVRESRRIARIGYGVAGIAGGLSVLAIAPGTESRGLLDSGQALLLAAVGGLILSFSVSSSMGLVATILQQTTPAHLRGRVMSVHGLVFMGLLPFASLLMTGLVDLITMPAELVVAATAVLLVGLPLFRALVRVDADRVAVEAAASAAPNLDE